MHRTIIVGSPREDGRSASLADQLFEACIEDCPQDGVSIVSVASCDVELCMGCNACQNRVPEDSSRAMKKPEEGDPLEPSEQVKRSDACGHVCIIDDEMQEVRKHIDAADELIIVSPVYFACVPAQLKALLDRLQPYYWSDLRFQKPKRALTIHIVGEGGDPHGFDPLVGTVRSATSVAGFDLKKVLNWVGCIDEDGEIQSEPEAVEIAPLGGSEEIAAHGTEEPVQHSEKKNRKSRPKLKLS